MQLPNMVLLEQALRRQHIEPCTTCRGSGWLHVDVDDFSTKQTPCVCRQEMSFQAGLRAGNVPPEFWGVEGFDFQYNRPHLETVTAYTSDLERHRRAGRGFTMLGENGAGKTAMGCLVLARALRAGMTAAYMTAHDYLAVLPRTWNDLDMKEWVDGLMSADFLVLDEMGKEYRAKEASRLAEMDSLLRTRRSALLSTIVITNMNLQEFKSQYGASIDSILADRNKVLLFQPGDYRKRKTT